MKKFEKLLKEYGLRLSLIPQIDEMPSFEDEIKEQLENSKETNAMERFATLSSTAVVIKVEDLSIFKEKMKVQVKYAVLKDLIMKDLCLELHNKEYGKIRSTLDTIEGYTLNKLWIKKELVKSPEKYGIDKTQHKISELFAPGKIMDEQAERIIELYKELLEDDEIHMEVRDFGYKAKKILEDLNDEPEWFYKKLELK